METGRRELKLWDLVPMQVTLIVWLGRTGFAASKDDPRKVLEIARLTGYES